MKSPLYSNSIFFSGSDPNPVSLEVRIRIRILLRDGSSQSQPGFAILISELLSFVVLEKSSLVSDPDHMFLRSDPDPIFLEIRIRIRFLFRDRSSQSQPVPATLISGLLFSFLDLGKIEVATTWLAYSLSLIHI